MILIFNGFLVGTYPRSEKLIQVTRDFDRQRISEQELNKQFNEDVLNLIALQKKSGFEFISDGLLKWQDHFRPLTENLNEVELGSLTRYYDNNTFFKKPIIKSKLSETNSKFILNYFFNEQLKGLKKKATLPSPYYFVSLSEFNLSQIGSYSVEEALFDSAKILNSIAKDLELQGFEFIQFSDPEIVYRPLQNSSNVCEKGLDLKQVFEVLLKNLNAKTSLHTFFGDFSKLKSLNILEFPFNGFGIDFTETNLNSLKEFDFSEKELTLEIVDSRNSLIESSQEIAKKAKDISKKLNAKKYFISSNVDLEFVPQTIAEKKVENIGKALKQLNNGD